MFLIISLSLLNEEPENTHQRNYLLIRKYSVIN